jgi:branched-chain amino acid transport system permease protein
VSFQPDVKLLSLGTALVLALIPLWAGGFWVYSISLLLANSINILSVSFLIRYAGEVSIGHNFFIAIGAYTIAILQNMLGVPFIGGLLIAVCLSTLTGLLFALPSRGLSGVYLSVATLALGLAVPEILLYFSRLTGGFEGLFVDSQIVSWLSAETQQYYVALLALCSATFAVYRFRYSRIGLAILTARDHPHAAASFGMTSGTARLGTFAVSAAIAGLGGAVLGFTTSMVSPNSFTFWNSVTLLVGSVVSLYSTRIYGVIVGGAFITATPQLLSHYGQFISIIHGLSLLGVILMANVGIPVLTRFIRRRRKRYV